MAIFVGFVLIVVAAVGARLVDLQVVGRARFVSYGLTQRDGFRVLRAGRGSILDRDGHAFAMSVAQPQVVADPTQVKDVAKVATALAKVTGADRADLESTLRKAQARRTAAGVPSRYVILDPQVSTAVATKLKDLALDGITTEDRYVRTDPSGTLARAVVGKALADGQVEQTSTGAKGGHQGLNGIEREYDRSLHGTAGKLFYEKDPHGRTIAGGRRRLEPAKPGTDLYLTLDQSLQYETEQALTDQVTATGAKGAMAVIMKPSTGEILSMASVSRHADDTVSGTGDARPLTAVFEPGSVNKMITIAGAMEEGEVTPETVFQVPSSLPLYDRVFTDHDPHPTQAWTTTDIIVTSSNIGTIKIAQQLGKAKVDQYLRSFGFGQASGLGFPSESAGIMRPLADWSGVDIGAVPIGQGVAVTALQMLSAYNVISNDGVYVAPKLVAATDAGRGRTGTAASSRRRVVSATTAQAMRGMLDKVVTDGTGKPAAVPGYTVGGKTGTARIPQAEHIGTDGYMGLDHKYHYQSTFVGVVDGADLSIIVTVEEAKTSIYGSDVAAPVFSHLAAMALRRYQIPPPALVAASERSVPELSTSAKEVGGEDVTGGPRATAG
ncbi:MAG: Penicillin-binding protein 2 [Acidimicrobiales bacterium]|nr:Penicillin-binding protein 2 [Acidimicrobiales bacterium]